MALGGDRHAARDAAIHAFAIILALGAAMVVLRHLAFLGIIRLTLRIMADVAADAFHRVQRFSTEWHANSFAGSTVRKISRGMWALDLLDDTLLVALLPSAVVLLGTALVLALYWPVMGLVVMVGVNGLCRYDGGAVARLRRAGRPPCQSAGTRGSAARSPTRSRCNAVVKAFGAEAREDQRLFRVVDKWRRRTHRVWIRGDGQRHSADDRAARCFARRSSAPVCGSGGRAAPRPAT